MLSLILWKAGATNSNFILKVLYFMFNMCTCHQCRHPKSTYKNEKELLITTHCNVTSNTDVFAEHIINGFIFFNGIFWVDDRCQMGPAVASHSQTKRLSQFIYLNQVDKSKPGNQENSTKGFLRCTLNEKYAVDAFTIMCQFMMFNAFQEIYFLSTFLLPVLSTSVSLNVHQFS